MTELPFLVNQLRDAVMFKGPHFLSKDHVNHVPEPKSAWLQAVLKKNPGQTLDLQDANSLTQENLDDIKTLIQCDRYRKIILAHIVDEETLKSWIPLLRKNHMCKLIVNGSQVSPNVTSKLRGVLNTERGIRKIFGKVDFRKNEHLTGRNTLWWALFGGNFVYSMAAALFSPYALLWSGLGFLALGAARVVSNHFFYQKLEKTKEKGFWKEPEHAQEYLAGREAGKSYLAWFNTKAWTTPGYLGYAHQQHDIPSVLPEKKVAFTDEVEQKSFGGTISRKTIKS